MMTGNDQCWIGAADNPDGPIEFSRFPIAAGWDLPTRTSEDAESVEAITPTEGRWSVSFTVENSQILDLEFLERLSWQPVAVMAHGKLVAIMKIDREGTVRDVRNVYENPQNPFQRPRRPSSKRPRYLREGRWPRRDRKFWQRCHRRMDRLLPRWEADPAMRPYMAWNNRTQNYIAMALRLDRYERGVYRSPDIVNQ